MLELWNDTRILNVTARMLMGMRSGIQVSTFSCLSSQYTLMFVYN